MVNANEGATALWYLLLLVSTPRALKVRPLTVEVNTAMCSYSLQQTLLSRKGMNHVVEFISSLDPSLFRVPNVASSKLEVSMQVVFILEASHGSIGVDVHGDMTDQKSILVLLGSSGDCQEGSGWWRMISKHRWLFFRFMSGIASFSPTCFRHIDSCLQGVNPLW